MRLYPNLTTIHYYILLQFLNTINQPPFVVQSFFQFITLLPTQTQPKQHQQFSQNLRSSACTHTFISILSSNIKLINSIMKIHNITKLTKKNNYLWMILLEKTIKISFLISQFTTANFQQPSPKQNNPYPQILVILPPHTPIQVKPTSNQSFKSSILSSVTFPNSSSWHQPNPQIDQTHLLTSSYPSSIEFTNQFQKS